MSELNKYPSINNEVIKEHGLSQDEYIKIKGLFVDYDNDLPGSKVETWPELIAEIKHPNTVSIKCFSKCGFHYDNADDDYIYLVKLM